MRRRGQMASLGGAARASPSFHLRPHGKNLPSTHTQAPTHTQTHTHTNTHTHTHKHTHTHTHTNTHTPHCRSADKAHICISSSDREDYCSPQECWKEFRMRCKCVLYQLNGNEVCMCVC